MWENTGPWYWIPPYLLSKDRSAAARRCACFKKSYDMYIYMFYCGCDRSGCFTHPLALWTRHWYFVKKRDMCYSKTFKLLIKTWTSLHIIDKSAGGGGQFGLEQCICNGARSGRPWPSATKFLTLREPGAVYLSNKRSLHTTARMQMRSNKIIT